MHRIVQANAGLAASEPDGLAEGELQDTYRPEDGAIDFVNHAWPSFTGPLHAGAKTLGGDIPHLRGRLPVEQARSQEALDAARIALAHASCVATLEEINATIAHEVNQPLAAILANAETCLRRLARDAPDLDKVRNSIEWVVRDAKRAADVIQGVRALFRRAEVRKEPLNLNEIIVEVKALLNRELAAQRVTLRLSLTPGIPLVMGDRVQLQQVFINLVMNAVEAMQGLSGRAPLLVVHSSHDQARGVMVCLKDNGIGIPNETRNRLFDAFFSTKANGLGIGLSICRSIIEDHDGCLSAVNNSGESGATFEVALPPVPYHVA